MKYAFILVFVLLTLGAVFGVYADDVSAGASAGAVEVNLLNSIFGGNIGFSLGLIVVVLGVVTMVRGSVGGGVTLIILGVLITITPGVYNAVNSLMCPAVKGLFSIEGMTCSGS